MLGLGFLAPQRHVTKVATTSGFTTLLDFTGDSRSQILTGGTAFGLYSDGPCIPYRNSTGFTQFFIPAGSENYRCYVPDNDWTGGTAFQINPSTTVLAGNNTGVEQDYDHRIWLFGLWHDGTNLYAIGHHEWYHDRKTVDGHPGYNATTSPGNRRWVTSPIWLKSTNNGSSWSTKSYTTGGDNDFRLFLTPELWQVEEHETLYGFKHPSNIVKEGDYWYAFLDTNNIGSGETTLTCGFSLIRWDDLEDPTSTEFWNGTAWEARDMDEYQGNQGTQQPYVFFSVSGYDPYTTSARNNRMAQAIRWHNPSQQWLLFGGTGLVAGVFCYTRSKSLAKPYFERNGRTMLDLSGGGSGSDYIGNGYISVFDPASTDRNFTDIGNNPIAVLGDDLHGYKMQTLELDVY